LVEILSKVVERNLSENIFGQYKAIVLQSIFDGQGNGGCCGPFGIFFLNYRGITYVHKEIAYRLFLGKKSICLFHSVSEHFRTKESFPYLEDAIQSLIVLKY